MRPGERQLAPGIPVDRIMLVLEEIGRLLSGEVVGRSRRLSGCPFHSGVLALFFLAAPRARVP
jgi:hypothetical protein